MKNIRKTTKKETGSVLVLVLLVVLISLIIGTSVLALGTQSRITSFNRIQDMVAQSAADAGLERAIQEINNAVISGTWSAGVTPYATNESLPDSSAEYSFKTAYDGVNGYRIVSVGTNNNRTRTVEASLRLKGIFENSIQCRNNIILKSGTLIDTIDSSISLDPADCSEKAIIGTNSTNTDSITLNYGVEVNGDVVVGPGGDTDTVIKDLGATYDQSYALGATIDFPPVTTPSLFGPDTFIGVPSGERTIGPGGDFPANGRFSGMTLRAGTTLRVIGDCTLYITGNVRMNQGSQIVLDSSKNAKLTIYIDGDWISDNDSGINNENQVPSQFTVYGTGPLGQKIDLKAKSEFYGIIYAPDADLTLYSGGSIYGSFVTNNFELKNPAKFYYDVTLNKTSVFDEGARFVVNRWREQ